MFVLDTVDFAGRQGRTRKEVTQDAEDMPGA
jgi:hypothetical protein